MPEETKTEKNIHRLFVWGIFLKAFDGVLETVGGIVLFFPGTLTSIVHFVITNDLLGDSDDFIFAHLRHWVSGLAEHSAIFVALYLLIHGVIKIGLAAGLLRKQLWAYPSAIIIFTLFIAYQLSHYVFTHSTFLLVLSALDAIIIWLTWHEYRYFKKYHLFAE